MATSYETVELGGASSVDEGLQFRLEAIDSLRTVVEGLTGNKAAPPLLAPKDAAPEEGAEKESRGFCARGFCATLGSVIVPLLTVGGALAASVLLTLIPFQGVCISFGMQVLGISIDKVRHGRGQTVFWPKVLDTSLLVCWFVLGIVLLVLPPEDVGIVREYGVLMVLGAVALIFVLSVLLSRPFVHQIMVDLVPQEYYQVEAGQSGLRTEKQTVLLHVGYELTKFSVLIVIGMWGANALNLFLNTELAENNKTLEHSSQLLNIALGVIAPIAVAVVGVAISPMVAKYSLRRLKAGVEAELTTKRAYSSVELDGEASASA